MIPKTVLTEEKLTENFDRLLGLVETICGPEWLSLVLNLGQNVNYDNQLYLGFRTAPAAKGNHHAYVGGLVEHLLEMWQQFRVLEHSLPADPIICESRVLKGIVMHDLHKAWCTFVMDDKVDSGLNYGPHPSNSLVRNDQKTMYLLNQAGIKLDLIDLNCLYSSEGGWAECPPKWITTLSKLVYLLDEMSGNVFARSIQGNNIDLRDALPFPSLCEVQFPH